MRVQLLPHLAAHHFLDPSQGRHVKGFNPFRARPRVELDVQVSGMVEALLRVWGSDRADETPTLERVLRLLFSAMIVRGIPLHDAFALVSFTEHKFREDVIASITEPIVRNAWRDVQAIEKRADWRAEVLSTQNRLYRLVASKTMRRFLGVVDPAFNLDVLGLMEEPGSVLLVNLKPSGTLHRDNARAFAALLLHEIFTTAVMFRDADTRGSPPRPFYVYLDEWQDVVTPDIGKIFAQARKFGMLLVLANQSLAQIRAALSNEFVTTLMNCCQVKACFGGLARDDAIHMVREMLVGQLDLNETKYVIESTKFWPTYGRDRVRSCSSNKTTRSRRSSLPESWCGSVL